MALNKEWKIATTRHACAVCSAKFEEKQRITSILEAHEEFLQRRDFCLKCWEKGVPDANVFSRWSKIYSATARQTLEPDELKEIFNSLCENREEDEAAHRKRLGLRYLMALFIVRRRIYKMSETYFREDSESVDIIIDENNKRVIEIPEFSPEELDGLKAEFSRLFDMGGMATPD